MINRIKSRTLYTISAGSLVLFVCGVIMLSIITPGYNTINHTVSRLAIEKYGLWQRLNLIQLSAEIVAFGYLLSRFAKNKKLKQRVISTAQLLSVSQIVTVLFPTDPIENVALNFAVLTPTGMIHFIAIFIVLAFLPYGTIWLSRSMNNDPVFECVSGYTLLSGLLAFCFSILWIFLFVMGWLLPYRGFFEKLIVMIFILWQLRMLSIMKAALPNRASGASEESG